MRWLLLALLVSGCVDAGTFTCKVDGDCGSGGVCEPGGACSFADPSCGSGRRFGKFSKQGGMCTGSDGAVPDGGDGGMTRDGGDGGLTPDGGPTVDGGMTSCFSQIAAGADFTCARQGGTAECWGYNDEGELGNGNQVRSSSPTALAALTDIAQLAPGGEYGCARTNAGAVWCWGNSDYHQIPGASGNVTVPRLVSGLPVATALTSGYFNSCVLDAAGAVTCWGDNGHMLLGDAMVHRTPVAIAGLPAAAQVVIGQEQGCVLARSPAGTVWCWGANDYGQLGDTTTMPRAAPVQTSISNVVELAAGNAHTCARKGDGTVWCWGDDQEDNLGNHNVIGPFSATPVQVEGLSGIVELAGHEDFTCARNGAGQVYCWGLGSWGQLGNGSTDYSNGTPQLVPIAPATAITVGETHACARTAAGIVCWGADALGQVGDGVLLYSKTPMPVTLPDVAEVSAGSYGTCARIQTDGSLYCWGNNQYGEVGDGSETQRTAPVKVPGFTGALQIEAGDQTNCFVGQTRDVRCWGFNGNGEIGNAESPPQEKRVPTLVSGLGDVSDVSMGEVHVCARKQADGSVWCWGGNDAQQLGDGTTMPRNAPVASAVTGTQPGLAAGVRKTCARTASGGVTCWGDNQYGELGDGSTQARTGAVTVITLVANVPLTGVLELASGSEHTCARTIDKVYCWGIGWDGQLGDGAGQPWSSAIEVPGVTASRIFAGGRETCALTAAGVQCWGLNLYGQLGNGSLASARSPVTVGIANVVDLAVGGDHVCARKSDRSLWCWGLNEEGQLGLGSELVVKVPKAALVACH